MKVLAARAAGVEGRGDREDIGFLMDLLDLRTTESVMAVVHAYYAAGQIPPRSAYLVDEIVEERDRSK